jgi:hypothetical protein
MESGKESDEEEWEFTTSQSNRLHVISLSNLYSLS